MSRNILADDLSRSLAAFEQHNTLVVVVEMSKSSWLVAGLVPGIERQPKKKLAPDPEALLRLVHRWRDEAIAAGRLITRIVLAYEAGRDGVWLARWLRSERGHCSMVAVPTMEQEDDRRPGREREALVAERTRIINRLKAAMAWLGIRGFKPQLRSAAVKLESLRTPEGVPIPPNTFAELRRDMARLAGRREQIAAIETARAERLDMDPERGPHPMIRLLARVRGVGIETAEMLVTEVMTRDLRDRRAVARDAGITGSPDESGAKRREKGLMRAGNARVRRGMIELAWRWLLFQKESALAL